MKREREISLVEIVKIILSGKIIVIVVTSLAIIAGLIVSFTTPEEWMSKSQLVPEARNSIGLGGSLGGLAGLAGVSVGNLGGGDGINPELYPEIVASTPFILDLMDNEYYFERIDATVSLFDYFNNHREKGLLGSITGSEDEDKSINRKPSKFIKLTKAQVNFSKSMSKRVSVSVDKLSGIITIVAKMQDAVVAAEVADFTVNYIKDYVTSYYRKKEEKKLNFVKEQFLNKEKNFEIKQQELADFRDRNLRLTSNNALSEEERLRSEFDIAFSTYNSLAQQLEEAKIKVEEITPVFTTLEPVIIPLKRATPIRSMIMIIYTLVGFTLGLGIVFLRWYISILKKSEE